jgi:hypothetical protein
MAVDPAVQGLTVAIASNEGYGNNNFKPSRYNNPGDLKAPWTGYPSDAAGITQFPDINTGTAALQHQANLMLNGGSSNFNPNMTIGQAAAKFTDNGPNAGANWAKTLDPSGKLVTQDTTLAQYQQLVANGSLVPPKNLPNPAANNATGTATNNNQNAPLENTTPDPMEFGDRNSSAVEYQPLTSQSIPQAVYEELDPNLVVKDGLNNTAWFQDQGLVTGNPRIRRFVAPVTFRMLINGTPLSTEGLSGAPIEVQLNASIKSYSKSMRHVYTKTPTRTGFNLTLWGQQADMIEAQCSTGVFMNQLGITDFLSTAQVSDDLIQLINSGFSHTVADKTGDVQVASQIIQRQTNNQVSAFRVAAQDAFVELLSLFKSNGNVWFRKDNYTGSFSGNDQAGVAAWSPQTGVSTQQGNARNNDVLTRGHIAMQLKNTTYLGFFKSLSWTQDASSPFQWNFNFVFQVERTIDLLEYPR